MNTELLLPNFFVYLTSFALFLYKNLPSKIKFQSTYLEANDTSKVLQKPKSSTIATDRSSVCIMVTRYKSGNKSDWPWSIKN